MRARSLVGEFFPYGEHHVLGWTLSRVVQDFGGAPTVTLVEFVDHALDRFAVVLGFPAIQPLPRLYLAALTHPAETSWSGKAPLFYASEIAVYRLREEEARHATIRLPKLPSPVFWGSPSSTPEPIMRRLEFIDLHAKLFASDGGEVMIFAEEGTAEEVLLVIGEAAHAKTRIDAFPGPERMRQRAWQREARRWGVELPSHRRSTCSASFAPR
jgi:hypothetical protein